MVAELAGELDRMEQPAQPAATSGRLWLVELSDPSAQVRAVRVHVAAADTSEAIRAAVEAVSSWMGDRGSVTLSLVPLEELSEPSGGIYGE